MVKRKYKNNGTDYTAKHHDSNKNERGVGDTLYSGAASYGKFQTVIGLIIGIPIGIGLIIFGIKFLSAKEVYTKKTTATIKKSTCAYIKDKKKSYYKCLMQIEYTIDGKKCPIKDFETNDKREYNKDSQMTIYYNPDDKCNDIIVKKPENKKIGGVLLGFGILIIIGSIISYYVVRKYKFAAAGMGAASVVGMFRRD